MLFHTSTFLVFFIAFLVCYLPVRRQAGGAWVIVIFSNIFYGWWNWKFLILLWATIVVDYVLALLLEKTEQPLHRKLLLCISLATNLGILGFFKYYNFFVDTIGSVGVSGAEGWRIADLALPVGISFYVFQSMSYAIDVYRRVHKPVHNLVEFAAFVCYFPHMVAGPIQRIDNLMPQILKPASITPERLVSGGFLFCVGLFRKSIADTFATFVDPVFTNLDGALPVQVVLAVFGFGLQIYLDFTGYIDMARGVSRTLGIDLLVNFNAPYLSTSPREFWRRWHISLSQWLRDYLYIPLGGSRHGMTRHLAALMTTMVLGGLWHGAGLNFMIWGALQGGYLVLNVFWDKARELLAARQNAPDSSASLAGRTWGAIRATLGWGITFLAMNYAWLYFRCTTFDSAMIANRKLGEWLLNPVLPEIIPALAVMVACVVVMEFMLRYWPTSLQVTCSELTLPRAVWQGAAAGLLFVAGLILLTGIPTQQFIYFQF